MQVAVHTLPAEPAWSVWALEAEYPNSGTEQLPPVMVSFISVGLLADFLAPICSAHRAKHCLFASWDNLE